MTRPAQHDQRQSWPWFIMPLTFALLGAALYAWGVFGLDNMPPTWAIGAHAHQHRYGEATFAYGAANLAFAGAFLTGIPCAALFLMDRARKRADRSMKRRG